METLAGKPRYGFKNGVLFITDDRAERRVRGWPGPRAEKRLRHNAWKQYEPDFQLIRACRRNPRRRAKDMQQAGEQLVMSLDLPPPRVKPRDGKKVCFDLFRNTLPDALAEGIERFQNNQWAIIMMVHRHGEPAMDLLESNPVLAYALANSTGFQSLMKHPEYGPRSGYVFRLKQRQILRKLKMPDTKSMLKLLRKVRLQSVTPETIETLVKSYRIKGAREFLSHLDVVNAGVIDLVSRRKRLTVLTPSLVREVSCTRREDRVPFASHQLDDLLHMARVRYPDREVQPLRSMEQLRALHDELALDFERSSSGKLYSCRVPPPPIPGNEIIVSLSEAAEIREEGAVMRHCVGSYIRNVAAGRCYIYRVLEPERATLSIKRNTSGQWGIGQLLGPGNAAVSDDTRREVRLWMNRGIMATQERRCERPQARIVA